MSAGQRALALPAAGGVQEDEGSLVSKGPLGGEGSVKSVVSKLFGSLVVVVGLMAFAL